MCIRDRTKDDYVALLKSFAATQHDPDGHPMVCEDHDPDQNKWLAQGANYNHSRYADLVITGLVLSLIHISPTL